MQQDWTNFSLQRPNYFPGQYLLDEDFELAHKYLSDRQRYINSKLHLAGIVEGLEVEAIAGRAEVIIKPGTAIDGEGNLIILPEATTRIINATAWLCLRFHQEPKLLQQPEIPDSFTRFLETPLLTLEAIETRDTKTVILAKVTPIGGVVEIDATVRQYSGVRLPGPTEAITLQSSGDSLTIKGKLSVMGALQLGSRTIHEISDQIDLNADRTDVIPSEKAVKDHLERRILERLANLNVPTQEKPAISVESKPDGLYGWQTEGGPADDQSSSISLVAYRAGEKTPRLSIERDTGKVVVYGSIHARHIASFNPMQHRMYPSDAIVYQDIFAAEEAKAIQKTANLPNASYDNRSYTANNLFHCFPMIRYGLDKEDQGGALLTMPTGYDTVWIRLGHAVCWRNVKAQLSVDNGKTYQDLGNWMGGYRRSNRYCPDGSLSDSSDFDHEWLPIPVGKAGLVTLVHKRSGHFWISGVGFSKNPWGHAPVSGGAFFMEDTGYIVSEQKATWSSDNWNGDVYIFFDNLHTYDIQVPVVPSGRDKLLYLIEHNNNWNGCSHTELSIKVGNKFVPIERFLSTYDNPFARHWNSKLYQRYIAARIPANLVADALPVPQAGDRTTQLLTVRIDLTKQSEGNGWEDRLYFREIGTHDLEVPDFG